MFFFPSSEWFWVILNNSAKTMKSGGVAWPSGGTGDGEEEEEGGEMEGKDSKGLDRLQREQA